MKTPPLLTRISKEDLADYLSWRLSSKEIAKLYDTKATYVTRTLPKRPPKEYPDKRALKKLRKEYRLTLAAKIDKGQLTAKDAADQAFCSVREIYRCLAEVRKQNA